MIAAHPDIAIAEKLEHVAAVALGVIYRGIGFLGQCFQIPGIFGVDGDTLIQGRYKMSICWLQYNNWYGLATRFLY